MESRLFEHPAGSSYSGTSVTVANLIMTDGKILEGRGVVPDLIILPGAGDLASGDDPVLAAAARQ
jgi:C-terminal processing protease CtpA/Prc